MGKKAVRSTLQKESLQKDIRAMSDYQLDWLRLIPTLKRYSYESVAFLSAMGDAPKELVTDTEYVPGPYRVRFSGKSYIAKVGSKFYPNESITEHLITNIGHCFGAHIAHSKLRIIDGQVRFMSRFFFNREREHLTHGAEIFERSLDKSLYKEIAEKKIENEYFTFQMACESIETAFQGYHKKIIGGLIQMLAFDALIGHNDRHPYNWAVIVPVQKKGAPQFSPIYDTARALFWNESEVFVSRLLEDKRPLLENYINKCKVPLCWDGEHKVSHFRLVSLIWEHYPQYRWCIEKYLVNESLKESIKMIDKDFRHLMSEKRRHLIKQCLSRRQEKLIEGVQQVQ